MLKVNTFKRFLPFVLLVFVLILIPITTPVLSQGNTCPALVSKLVQQARTYCAALDSGQICYASNLTSQFTDSQTALAKSGDLAPLSKLQSVAGQGADVNAGTWGIGLLKLHTTPSAEFAPTLVILGDAKVTNLVDTTKPLPVAVATNRNRNNLNIFAGPDAKSAVIGQLVPLEQVTANGRTDASDWLRVQYKDALGWVAAGGIALDSEIVSLNVATVSDLLALYPEAVQAITLESNPSTGCADTPNGLLVSASNGFVARLLVNGVQLETTGSAFLTAAQDGNLTVTGISGLTTVTAANKSVTVKLGFSTKVPLSGFQAKDAPGDPAASDSANLTGLYASLINGQPYSSTPEVPGLRMATRVDQVAVGDAVDVPISFTGDSALCPVTPIKPQDVALVVDTSEAMLSTSPDVIRASVSELIRSFEGSDNRVALIGFDSTGQTLAAFGEALPESASRLITQKSGAAGTIQAGLSEALIALKSARPDAQQAIILVTASAGDSALVEPVATDAKGRNIRLVAIGMGKQADQALLTQAASSATDALLIDNPLGLRSALTQAYLSLTRPIAARDVSLTFTFDPAQYEFVESSLVGSGARLVNDHTAQQVSPVLYDGQVLKLPAVVRPLKDGSQSVGTVKLTYQGCAAGPTIATPDVAGPTLSASQAAITAEKIPASIGVLRPGETGVGVISPFGEARWLLNAPGDQTVSVMTTGTEAPLVAAIDGSTIAPLYTLDNANGEGSTLNVFYLPPGAQWLSLNSPSEKAAGSYTVTFNKGIGIDPTQLLSADGPPLRDSEESNGGHLYAFDRVGKDQVVTVRLDVENKIDTSAGGALPFQIVSLDGQYADKVFTMVDTNLNEYVAVVQLRGAGPYYAVVKVAGNYTIRLDKDDTLVSPRDALKLGVDRKSSTRGGKTEALRYDLPIATEGRYSITTRNVNRVLLSTENNEPIPFVAQIKVADFQVYSYDLKPGTYRVFLEAVSAYEFAAASGDVVTNLKGSLAIGQALDEALPEGQSFALYRLVSGSVKPPAEGDLLTVQLTSLDTTGATHVSGDSVWFESLDGLSSSTIQFAVDNSGSSPVLISAQQLKGRGPYRVRINGLTKYRLVVSRGDQLSNDKGPIILGQTVKDSSRIPSVITYTVTTQVGKQLSEGDVLTITYLPQVTGAIDPSKEPQFGTQFKLEDGARQPISEVERYLFQKQLRIVYRITGKPPYRLTIPNLGAYTLSVDPGNKLRVDQGGLKFDNKAQGQTDGPQILQYTLEAPETETVTVAIKDQRGNRNNFAANVLDGNGKVVRPRRLLADPTGSTQTYVYVLGSKGPFSFSFLMDGFYEVTMTRGDKITLYQGEFFMGDEETVQVKGDPRLAAYTINIPKRESVSIDLAGSFTFFLTNSNGDVLNEDYFMYLYDNGAFKGIRKVYTLDPGKYEISFFTAGTYTLKVKEGDKLVVDKGNLFYSLTETDTLANDKRIGTYTISGNEGDMITLQLTMDDFRQSGIYLFNTPLVLSDANNVPLEIQEEISDYGYFLRTYKLTGPGPYKLLFQPQRDFNGDFERGNIAQHKFTFVLTKGDSLRFERGILLPGQQVVDNFDATKGTKRAVYRINLDEGKDITLRIETPNGQGSVPLNGQLRIIDANDQILSTTALTNDQNALLISYRLVGPGPYRFIMDTFGDYAITLSEGDLIQTDFGSLDFDKTVDSTLKAPAVIAAYQIPGKEGDLISIKVNTPSAFPLTYLEDSNHILIPPDNLASDQGTTVFVFTLAGPGPYRLRLFYVGTSPFKITLSGGGNDILSAQLGDLPVNPKSDDPKFQPVVISKRLDAPAHFANYTFTAKDGDLITLDLKSSGGDKPLSPVISNQVGEVLAPEVTVPDRANLLAVYKMHGDGPYKLVFETTQQYSISLTGADIVRADAGMLPTGLQEKLYSNELPKPAIVAVHQLDVAPDQLITIQIKNNNRVIDLQIHDGTGRLLQPEATDFQNGTNVYVYIMSGAGPYQAQFAVNGKYEASVLDGNLLRVDGGLLKFNEPTDGQLAFPGRVTTFVLDGKRGQTVTIRLQADGQARGGELRDANGKQWVPAFQFTVNNQQYSVYQLSGPAPYSFTFTGTKYSIQVSEGDALRSNQGDVPFEQPITNTLDAPSVIAVYNIPGQPGELVSFQLQDRGQPVDSDLFDADQKELKRDVLVTKNGFAISVYTLSGKAPYHYEFLTRGPYKLTVTKGNVLNANLGSVPLGRQITNTLTAPAENIIYTVDAQEGQTLTVELQVAGAPGKSKLINGQGKELTPIARLERNNFAYSVFTLSGPAPYTLTFNTTQQYNLTVTRDNTIRVEVGVVRFDNTVTNTLKAPAAIAVHTIDAQPGDTITIKLQDQNQPIDSQLVDADGNLLSPIGKAVANNATYTIYTLYGTPPYKVSFLPKGQYTITLTRGSVYRVDLGVIPFGTKVSDQLKAPAITGVYTINAAPNQIISVQIVSKGQAQFIPGVLRSADGTEIVPIARHYNGTNTTAYVYMLAGQGPYTFSFETTQPYEIQFTHGDIGQTQFDIYPTATPTPTPTPTPAPES